MSEMKTLAVQKRDTFGKGPNRRLRAQSLVPCVYYSAAGENMPLQVAALPLDKVYEQVGRTNVFNLEIEDGGKKSLHPVFVWQAQYHPVKNRFTHVDFMGVDLNKEIKITVPVEYEGVSRGVKAGGNLEVYQETLVLSAKPQLMPRRVTVDVTSLEINSTFRISDLKLPEGVSAVARDSMALVAVTLNTGKNDDAAVE